MPHLTCSPFRRGFGLVALAAIMVSCSSDPKPLSPVAVTAPQKPLAATAPEGKVIPLNPARPEESHGPRQPEIIRGTGSFTRPTKSEHPTILANGNDTISLTFVNADISEVAKAVLGDFLHVNYVIDAAVQGTVTLQASKPLPRTAVLSALEMSFRLSGLALLQNDGIYRIVSISDAARRGVNAEITEGTRPRAPGFGVEIVPLTYISTTEMQKVLEPLIPPGSILRADTARNFLLIAGTAQDRQGILENIATFDVDWMSGMSFAIFNLKYANAHTVVGELTDVMGGHDSPIASLVRLVTIDRMNAILAISPQAHYLDQIKDWLTRFDIAQESADRRLYIYYVQNGRAADLARVMGKAMGGESNSNRPNDQAGSDKDPTKGNNSDTGEVPKALLTQLGAGSGSATAGSTNNNTGLSFNSPGGGNTSSTQSAAKDRENASNNQPRDDSYAVPNGLRITADELNNALLVFATSQEYDGFLTAAHQLDNAPLQVMLEEAIAEVTLTDDLAFGIQYAYTGKRNQASLSSSQSATPAPSFPGFSYTFTTSSIIAVLNALEGLTSVNVVSAPRVLVLNNQTAQLEVGDEVPIATQSQQSTISANAPIVNTIDYRETGIILKVTPRVNDGGLVTMDVTQEVSDVAQTTSSTLNSPTIQQRKLNSTIAVHDGETVALGGLIKDSRTKERNGIPYLQDIPYLGSLFSNYTNSGTRTELIVLITPHVVQGTERLREVTAELRRKMPATEPVLHLGQ